MSDRADVVIVGGGIAGGALAIALAKAGLRTVVLERLEHFRDLVNGELLQPWGVAEAERLGMADAIYAAGAWPLRWWVRWDEIFTPDEAPSLNLDAVIPGNSTAETLAISHPETCQAFAEAAEEAGVSYRFGVKDVRVSSGAKPEVCYWWAGRDRSTPCRLVVGAGGRGSPVARQVGLHASRYVHHWGAGLAVEGLEGWPEDTQALGTEGDVMFFVFPKGDGRARLYLNFATEQRQRFAGPHGWKRFMDAFRLRSLPYAESVLATTPAGPCASRPSASTVIDRPFTDGVVLIGDEAGMNDSVLGTGLSCALRDARIVTDILLQATDWSPQAFTPYEAERRERMRRLHSCAKLMATLWAEFGPEARERRRRALRLMDENPARMIFLQIAAAGPEMMPGIGVAEFLRDRFLSTPSDRGMLTAAV